MTKWILRSWVLLDSGIRKWVSKEHKLCGTSRHTLIPAQRLRKQKSFHRCWCRVTNIRRWLLSAKLETSTMSVKRGTLSRSKVKRKSGIILTLWNLEKKKTWDKVRCTHKKLPSERESVVSYLARLKCSQAKCIHTCQGTGDCQKQKENSINIKGNIRKKR